jgi:predicted phage terminase large subunit-like protein
VGFHTSDFTAEMAALSTNPTKFAAAIDELVVSEPGLIREWVQEHPQNLMAYHGWGVQDFHKAAFNDVLTEREFLWLAPRGSGKSTAEAVFFPAWLAIADPEIYTQAANEPYGPVEYLFPDAPKTIGPHNIRIALTSNSQEKAVSLQWQAKQILVSQKMEVLFGGLAGSRWRDAMSDTSLRTEKLREGTFTSLGLGSKVTGGHYDIVIPDDWVTEDNARTELQRRRLSDFWKFTVRPTVEPWARVAAAGTRYHPNDWYQDLRDLEEKGLWGKVRRTPALTEIGGNLYSYWPEVYPVEELLRIKETIGAIAFSTQYQNETEILLGEFFEKAWTENFRSFDALPEADRNKARTLISLDPAIKAGPRNDYSVFTVLSYVAPYFFVRRVVRGQWTQHELIKIAETLHQSYRADIMGVEVVQGQEWLVQELRRQTSINIRELRPTQFKGKDKVGRASQVRTLFERERVFFEEPTPDNSIGRLIEEMMAFPNASTVPGMDDCVDSLVWGLLLLVRPQARMIRLAHRRSL